MKHQEQEDHCSGSLLHKDIPTPICVLREEGVVGGGNLHSIAGNLCHRLKFSSLPHTIPHHSIFFNLVFLCMPLNHQRIFLSPPIPVLHSQGHWRGHWTYMVSEFMWPGEPPSRQFAIDCYRTALSASCLLANYPATLLICQQLFDCRFLYYIFHHFCMVRF